jgi:hypothetical protein
MEQSLFIAHTEGARGCLRINLKSHEKYIIMEAEKPISV